MSELNKEHDILKYYNFDIVFQEIPDEVTIAVNITNCPFRCPECHSPHLRENIGIELNEAEIDKLIKPYANALTCFCFMGGDRYPFEIDRLSRYIKDKYGYKNTYGNPFIKTAWYSGNTSIVDGLQIIDFDYIKIGPYLKEFGPLKSKTTNQVLYKIHSDGKMDDITSRFWLHL